MARRLLHLGRLVRIDAAAFAPAVAVLVVAVLAAGCSGGGGESARLRVVATTAVLAEFAGHVAGPDADVAVLIPSGVDEHSFEAAPEAARRIATAGLLIVNGYNLEEGLLRVVVQNRRSGVPLVVASAGLTARAAVEDHAGEPPPPGGVDPLVFADGDPHFWLAVPNAVRYVENIRDALVAADAAHADGYRQRADAYLGTLRALDGEMRAAVAQIPAEQRRLVVFHDAYGYFAQEYGFALTASVLPASPNQQPSAQHVSDLIALVQREHVPAVYREPQFSAQVLDAIAQETGARVLTLYSTYAGPVADYAALMRANAAALVDGLAGPAPRATSGGAAGR